MRGDTCSEKELIPLLKRLKKDWREKQKSGKEWKRVGEDSDCGNI